MNLFCQRVKTIGDELRELGDTVSDSQLINIVVGGLSEDFDKQASFIPMIRLPPTFAEVRSLLQLAAETQARKDSRPKVFHAAARPPLSSTPAPPSSPAPAAGPSASSSVQLPHARVLARTTAAKTLSTGRRRLVRFRLRHHQHRVLHHPPVLHLRLHGGLLMILGRGLFKHGPCPGPLRPPSVLRRHTQVPGNPAFGRLLVLPGFSTPDSRPMPIILPRRMLLMVITPATAAPTTHLSRPCSRRHPHHSRPMPTTLPSRPYCLHHRIRRHCFRRHPHLRRRAGIKLPFSRP